MSQSTISQRMDSLSQGGNGTSVVARIAPAAATSPDSVDTMKTPLVVVPAGFIGDLLGSLTGTIGEITGGALGNAGLGRQLGDLASPIAKLLPFQVIPPDVAPQSAGPDAVTGSANENLVVVPSAFLGGLLGGIGGNLLGGALGGLFGNKNLGSSIGSTVLGAVGSILPFQVIPPTALAPQSAGPNASPTEQEAMIVVPAGFFGDLISSVASGVSSLIPGRAGQIVRTASPLAKLLPFQVVPPELAPASVGPDGTTSADSMVVVPAGFFGGLLSGLAGTVGSVVGGLLGNAKTGGDIGNAVAPVLNLLPFHEVPPNLLPQAATPAAGSVAEPVERMLVVPASLFGSLLHGLGGLISDYPSITGAITPIIGKSTAAPVRPFQTLAPAMVGADGSPTA